MKKVLLKLFDSNVDLNILEFMKVYNVAANLWFKYDFDLNCGLRIDYGLMKIDLEDVAEERGFSISAIIKHSFGVN